MANNFSLFGGYTHGKHEECTSASTEPEQPHQQLRAPSLRRDAHRQPRAHTCLRGDVRLSGHCHQYAQQRAPALCRD